MISALAMLLVISWYWDTMKTNMTNGREARSSFSGLDGGISLFVQLPSCKCGGEPYLSFANWLGYLWMVCLLNILVLMLAATKNCSYKWASPFKGLWRKSSMWSNKVDRITPGIITLQLGCSSHVVLHRQNLTNNGMI